MPPNQPWPMNLDRSPETFEPAARLLQLERLAGERPDYADVHNALGVERALTGALENALESFDRALELNGDYAEAHLNRAIVLNELGRYDSAEVAFQKAAELDVPDSDGVPTGIGNRLAVAHARLGDLYRAAGSPERATEEYRRALELRPTFLDIRARLGAAYLETAEFAQAREELEAILSRNPNLTGARVQLGVVLHRMGEIDAAVEEWIRCLEDDPSDIRPRAYLASVSNPAVR